MPGKYYYSIKLCRNKGTESEQITTLINKKLFWILGEAPKVNEKVQRLNGLLYSEVAQQMFEIENSLELLSNENEKQQADIEAILEVN
jgi:hypothetical protein